jgi:hypothetical protein
MRSIFIMYVRALPDYAAHDNGGVEEQLVRPFIHLINRPKKMKWISASMVVIAASTTVFFENAIAHTWPHIPLRLVPPGEYPAHAL